jgi:phospholipid/cholesterol/gamma-HCH transport system permease protein
MTTQGELCIDTPSGELLQVILTGDWLLNASLPSIDEIQRTVKEIPGIRVIILDARQVTNWDSGLLTFLLKLHTFCTGQNINLDTSNLPQGALRLLNLASAVPAKKDARKKDKPISFLTHVGDEAVDFFQSSGELLAFIGDALVAFLRLLQGKAQFRRSDLSLLMESSGAAALPIVTLICFLVGLILAFIGAIQLQLFGAQIFVADLVGIAMVRLMGAIMTGIVMAGRTGGAFAAQLGTMQVNQEIDALKTLGISPMEFLVLPRMLALALMMPLLCLYANVMGILGGMVVGVWMLDIGFIQYFNETAKAVNLWNLAIGLFSGTVFGIIVALAGCMRGMQCGRSASAVGDAATSAVVTAIVGIIVTTAIITLICNMLGI